MRVCRSGDRLTSAVRVLEFAHFGEGSDHRVEPRIESFQEEADPPKKIGWYWVAALAISRHQLGNIYVANLGIGIWRPIVFNDAVRMPHQ